MDGTCCPQGSCQAELGDARAARAALVQAMVMMAVVMERHLAHRKFSVELGKRRGKSVCICVCVCEREKKGESLQPPGWALVLEGRTCMSFPPSLQQDMSWSPRS